MTEQKARAAGQRRTRPGAKVGGAWTYRGIPRRFDVEGPASVYLVAHPEKSALKVGVTGGARLEEHQAHGWVILGNWWFAVGYDAIDVEERVLDRWRNLYSLRAQLGPHHMPQGGSIETVMDTKSTRSDTIQFINHLHEGHESPWEADPASEFDPWDVDSGDWD